MAIVGGSTWTWVVKLVLAILKPLMGIITPQLDKALKDWIKAFAAKCYATPNPWDDLLADFLKSIFDIA